MREALTPRQVVPLQGGGGGGGDQGGENLQEREAELGEASSVRHEHTLQVAPRVPVSGQGRG